MMKLQKPPEEEFGTKSLTLQIVLMGLSNDFVSKVESSRYLPDSNTYRFFSLYVKQTPGV